MAITRIAKRLTVATMLAGLWARCPALIHAQQAPVAAAPAPSLPERMPRTDAKPAAPASPLPANLLTQVLPSDRSVIAGTESSAGIAFSGDAPAGDKPKTDTCWSKVPVLSPQPRPGSFLMPPTGCGYYTLRDRIEGNEKDKAPASPYRLLCYDNDFRYLDKTDGQPVDFLDRLKRMHFCGDGCDECGRPLGWMFSLGGEERIQLKNEIGGANGRLNGKDNNYQLLRTRVYGDLWYSDKVRVYVEYLDAQSYNQDLPPLAIDQDHSDLLNAFVDVKLGSINDNPIYGRIGRQELLYGSQRLVSPLDWANTRRTFEGAKLF